MEQIKDSDSTILQNKIKDFEIIQASNGQHLDRHDRKLSELTREINDLKKFKAEHQQLNNDVIQLYSKLHQQSDIINGLQNDLHYVKESNRKCEDISLYSALFAIGVSIGIAIYKS